MELHLDVHCELYPLEINQKFTFVLTKTVFPYSKSLFFLCVGLAESPPFIRAAES